MYLGGGPRELCSRPCYYFTYRVGLKHSGPISELDSTSGRTPADTLMSTPLPSHTLLAVSCNFRCIAGVLGQCRVASEHENVHLLVYKQINLKLILTDH